jgi:hypothetical protein
MLSRRCWRRKRWCGDLGGKRARAVGPRGARGRGERDDTVCVAGGGLTTAAASDGASGGGDKTEKNEKRHSDLRLYIGRRSR